MLSMAYEVFSKIDKCFIGTLRMDGYECPNCGADLLYYKNGHRARCLHGDCGLDTTAKAIIRIWKSVKASSLLMEGYSIRETARKIGLAKATVNTIKNKFIDGDSVQCGCGKKAGHPEWCEWRLHRSPKRQAYLNQFKDNSCIT